MRTPAAIALAFVVVIGCGCRTRRWDGRPRHIEILRPFDFVALSKRPYRDGVSSYGLEVAGTCRDCRPDERIDVTVRPPATSAYVGRAVAQVTDEQWVAAVFVGDDRYNRIRDGETLQIEAVVRGADDRPPAPPRGTAQRSVAVHGVP
jgi:hypothetical protein